MPEPENTPAVNEHGYPDNTPTADMSTEHQVAYWKHHARKHEAASKAGPDAAELERLRAADAELATRKAAELSDVERVQAEKATAEQAAATARADADAAVRKALLLEVALSKGLTGEQAARLQGSTKEELEADADKLTTLFGAPTPQAPRAGGPRGGDVGNAGGVTSGAERFRQKHGK
ncbi:hypothetical protein [Streptomyces californicus]|uniref:hypothetical protein n=1 Tax=Streptomyces californicus TaxID=67351 RepID=UPI0004BE8A6B|nr:hypothetical protein [Streptomyces californicus]QRV53514.1 hypothetical protein I6J40_04360 [Streptomyces californicus]